MGGNSQESKIELFRTNNIRLLRIVSHLAQNDNNNCFLLFANPICSKYKYEDLFLLDRVENIEKKKPPKIYLYLVLVTSGETLNHLAKELQNKGFEVIKFGLGLSHKLSFEKISSFYLLEN